MNTKKTKQIILLSGLIMLFFGLSLITVVFADGVKPLSLFQSNGYSVDLSPTTGLVAGN